MTATPAAADAVLFVLLDAFRHDYLPRTRFLKSLAPRSLVGQLEEPFGFCPRGAYFGGLSMAEQGYTHLFHYDPAHSVFRWTRDLSTSRANHRIGRALGPQIRQRARASLPAFAARSVNPWGIPLDWQHYFDVSERHAPWSPEVGYRSLFHVLDEAERPWVEASWPFLDLPEQPTDGVVAGSAMARLTGDHAFAYLHLPSLDAIGHAHGPGAPAVQDGIGEVDRLCELVTARALELFDDPVIVFAGDHGMLPVVRTVDALATLRDTCLRFGHDFAFFVDSTMVRCWFFTAEARRTTEAALTAIGGGHWIDDDERHEWGLDGLDVRNFDACFLADPGVVFSPSFFDSTGHYAPKGMHGYAPNAADNRALFLAHRPAARHHGDVGVVEARRLYPTFLTWLGFDAPAFTAVPAVIPPAEGAGRSQWFASAQPAADALVDAQLARTVAAVRERAPEATAVVLTGGFGRGEGTPDGTDDAARPSNDYDVLVVGVDGQALEGLADGLAREFDIDFVDLAAGRALERGPVARLCDFDLRYGSRVLWGDPAIVERLGAYAPAEIDRVEAAFLVGNRMGGLLVGLTGQDAGGPDDAYLGRQTAKFLIGLADAWLIAIGDYGVSYVVRRRRFQDLSRAGGFSPETAALIDRAYAAKLGVSGEPALSVPVSALLSALEETERALGWDSASGGLIEWLREAVVRHIVFVDAWKQRAAALGLSPIARAGFWPSAGEAVYHAVTDVLHAWPEGPAAQAVAARAALGDAFDGLDTLADTEAARVVGRLWLGFFH